MKDKTSRSAARKSKSISGHQQKLNSKSSAKANGQKNPKLSSQSKPTSRQKPKLQPPGAGLPVFQMFFIKALAGPVLSKIKTPSKSREEYEGLVHKLVQKLSKIPPQKRKIQVLVRPLPGLEDSSRYWSLNDLLEHLLIVSKNMEAVILSLSSGVVPARKADTAKVKPTGNGKDYFAQFKKECPPLMKSLDQKLAKKGMNFNSKLKFRHPWFGAITAKQWYWMLGTHLGVHYTQAKEIISGLKDTQ